MSMSLLQSAANAGRSARAAAKFPEDEQDQEVMQPANGIAGVPKASFSTTPDRPTTALGYAADYGLSALGALGNFLDVPGSMVRDVTTWVPGGIEAQNPFDQLLTPFSGDNRVTGEEMLQSAGIVDKDSWPGFLGGLAVEIGLDPLTYLSGGSLAVGKGGLAAAKAGFGKAAVKRVAQKKADDLAQKAMAKPTKIGSRTARMTTTVREVLDDYIDTEVLQKLRNDATQSISQKYKAIEEAARANAETSVIARERAARAQALGVAEDTLESKTLDNLFEEKFVSQRNIDDAVAEATAGRDEELAEAMQKAFMAAKEQSQGKAYKKYYDAGGKDEWLDDRVGGIAKFSIPFVSKKLGEKFPVLSERLIGTTDKSLEQLMQSKWFKAGRFADDTNKAAAVAARGGDDLPPGGGAAGGPDPISPGGGPQGGPAAGPQGGVDPLDPAGGSAGQRGGQQGVAAPTQGATPTSGTITSDGIRQGFSSRSRSHQLLDGQLQKLGDEGVLDQSQLDLVRVGLMDSSGIPFRRVRVRSVDEIVDDAGTDLGAKRTYTGRNFEQGGKQIVELSRKAFENPAKKTSLAAQTLLHEFGHAFITTSAKLQDAAGVSAREVFQGFLDDGKLVDYFTKNYSQARAAHYLQNPDEAFAQIFSDHVLKNKVSDQQYGGILASAKKWLTGKLDKIRSYTDVDQTIKDEAEAMADLVGGYITPDEYTKRVAQIKKVDQVRKAADAGSAVAGKAAASSPAVRAVDDAAEQAPVAAVDDVVEQVPTTAVDDAVQEPQAVGQAAEAAETSVTSVPANTASQEIPELLRIRELSEELDRLDIDSQGIRAGMEAGETGYDIQLNELNNARAEIVSELEQLSRSGAINVAKQSIPPGLGPQEIRDRAAGLFKTLPQELRVEFSNAGTYANAVVDSVAGIQKPVTAPAAYAKVINKGAPDTDKIAFITGKHNDEIAAFAKGRDDMGVLVTPDNISLLNHANKYSFFAVDNGAFGKYGFRPKHFAKLIDKVAADPDLRKNLLFVVAPDVVGDAEKTLEMFKQYAPMLRERELPVAFVAQDGLENMLDRVPWDDFDVLFVGGSDQFKLGEVANKKGYAELFGKAQELGKPIHLGRANSNERIFGYGPHIGAATADGTMLAIAPRQNLQKLKQWLKATNEDGIRYEEQLYPELGRLPSDRELHELASDVASGEAIPGSFVRHQGANTPQSSMDKKRIRSSAADMVRPAESLEDMVSPKPAKKTSELNPFQMTKEEYVAAKEQRLVRNRKGDALPEKALKSQRESWERDYEIAIQDAPRDADISLRVLESLPDPLRERLLKLSEARSQMWTEYLLKDSSEATKLVSGIVKSIVDEYARKGYADRPRKLLAKYSYLSDADKVAAVRALAKAGVVPEFIGRKRKPISSADLYKEIEMRVDRAYEDHTITNPRVPFAESEFYKKASLVRDVPAKGKRSSAGEQTIEDMVAPVAVPSASKETIASSVADEMANDIADATPAKIEMAASSRYASLSPNEKNKFSGPKAFASEVKDAYASKYRAPTTEPVGELPVMRERQLSGTAVYQKMHARTSAKELSKAKKKFSVRGSSVDAKEVGKTGLFVGKGKLESGSNGQLLLTSTGAVAAESSTQKDLIALAKMFDAEGIYNGKKFNNESDYNRVVDAWVKGTTEGLSENAVASLSSGITKPIDSRFSSFVDASTAGNLIGEQKSLLQKIASAYPSFAVKGFAEVDDSGKLVFGNGPSTVRINPDRFGLEDLPSGSIVGFDLDDFGVAKVEPEGLVRQAFRNAGFDVKKTTDGVSVRQGTNSPWTEIEIKDGRPVHSASNKVPASERASIDNIIRTLDYDKARPPKTNYDIAEDAASSSRKATEEEIREYREAKKKGYKRRKDRETTALAKSLRETGEFTLEGTTYRGEAAAEKFWEFSQKKIPPTVFKEFPHVPTKFEMQASLKSDQRGRVVGVDGSDFSPQKGEFYKSRLDIPAYNATGNYIVTLHDKDNVALGYTSAVRLLPDASGKVVFETSPRAALNIAADKVPKTSIAKVNGVFDGSEPEEVVRLAREAFENKDEWVQLSMNPDRGSGFFNKETGRPVKAADEVIQVGALVLAKKEGLVEATARDFQVGKDGNVFFDIADDVATAGARSADEVEDAARAWAEQGTESPYFKRWSNGLPVVRGGGDEYEGGAAVFEAYHGTTHSGIDKFEQVGNKQGFLGEGPYFTTTAEDASSNYAGVGPDLAARISNEESEIAEAFYDDSYYRSEVIQDYVDDMGLDVDVDDEILDELADEYGQRAIEHRATKNLKGDSGGLMMKTFVKLENPADTTRRSIRSGNDFTYELQLDADGDVVGESGTLLDWIRAADKVLDDYGVAGKKDYTEELLGLGGDASLSDALDLAYRHFEGVYDYDGESVSPGAIFREIAQAAGYDGIIMDADKHFGSGRKGFGGARIPGMTGVNDGTYHIVPFKPEQIKSATGNRGTFSPTDPRINYDLSDGVDAAKDLAGKAASKVAGTAAKTRDYLLDPSLRDDFSARLAYGMDAASDMLFDNRLSASVSGLFSPEMMGAVNPEAQMLAPERYRQIDADKAAMRDRMYPVIRSVLRSPAFDERAMLNSGLSSKEVNGILIKNYNAITEYIEGAKVLLKDAPRGEGAGAAAQAIELPAELESLRPALNQIKGELQGIRNRELGSGLKSVRLDDLFIDYLPRQRFKFAGDKTLTGKLGKFLEPQTVNQIPREDFLKDIPGGTALINEITIDPKISGWKHLQPDKAIPPDVMSEMREYLVKTYGGNREAGDRLFMLDDDNMQLDQFIQWVTGLDPRHAELKIPAFKVDPFSSVLARLEAGAVAAGGAELTTDWLARSARTTRQVAEGTGKEIDGVNLTELISRFSSDGFDRDRLLDIVVTKMGEPYMKERGRLQEIADERLRTKLENALSDGAKAGEVAREGQTVIFQGKEYKYKGMTEDMDKIVLTRTLYDDVESVNVLPREVSAPTVGRNTVLRNFKIDKGQADAMVRYMNGFTEPDAATAIREGLTSITNLYRSGLTVVWPAFHVRNVISGMYQNFLGGAFSARSMKEADAIFRGQDIDDAINFPAVRRAIQDRADKDLQDSVWDFAVMPPEDKSKSAIDAYIGNKKVKVVDAERTFGGGANVTYVDDAGKEGTTTLSKLEAAKVTPTKEMANEELRRMFFVNRLFDVNQGMTGEFLAGDMENLRGQLIGDTKKRLRDILKPPKAPPGTSKLQQANPLAAAGVFGNQQDAFLPYRWGRQAGQYAEGLVRGAPFIELLRKGYVPEEAARKVRELQFDYSRTTPADRYARIAFPFWSYTKNIVPLTVRQLMESPGGALAQTIRASSNAKTDEPLPGYLTSTAAIPFGRRGGASEGQSSFITGLGLGFEDPLQLSGALSGNFADTGRNIVSRMNPLFKAPLEAAFGESSYYDGPGGGRALTDLDPTYGRIVSNITDMVTGENTIRPKPIFNSPMAEQVLSNLPTSRIGTTLRTVTDKRKWENPAKLLLNLGTGVRVTDLSEAAWDADVQNTVMNMMKDMGARDFTRTYFPQYVKDQMTEEEKQTSQEIQGLLDWLATRAKNRSEQRKLENAAEEEQVDKAPMNRRTWPFGVAQ